MGYRHTREEILEAAVDVALSGGLHSLTFGRVAGGAGTSDRMVVYYFPTKTELITAVLGALGDRLQITLAPTLAQRCDEPAEFARLAWPMLASADADPVFALLFEAIGLAVSGREPYHSLAPVLVDGWVVWTSQAFTGTPARRRAKAEAAVALIDGLLLLRQTCGAAVADRAARTLIDL